MSTETEVLEKKGYSNDELHIYYNAETVRTDELGMQVFDYKNDEKAIKSYFKYVVNSKQQFFHSHEEKLEYMLENNYWDKGLFDNYKHEEIIELFDLAFSYKFRFKSYMAANTFYQTYAIWSRDGQQILERYEDRLTLLSLFYGKGDIEKAKEYLHLLITQKYQPATPTFEGCINIEGASLGD